MVLNEKQQDKFPRIVVMKISNGFLVAIVPQDKELQKMMQSYVKNIMDSLQNLGDGEEWKQSMQKSIDDALTAKDDSVKLYICRDAIEVMTYIAPSEDKDAKIKSGKPDLSWFWSEEGHIPD